ncbi:MAG: 2-hydroxyacyl-CoA dehydratase [Candidatus Zixiibacteriota bacterium]|jgi:benzoyl-CoA reductase/2-hydroxyglutaryl-CoA dehydratase subunit BcrC/BadD/HgdB
MTADTRIGITTTLPIEVLLAAGFEPVDLNNLFIGLPDPEGAVSEAEGAGFPRNTCAWIKGIYATVRAEGIGRVAVVTGGDCSNAVALGEVLADEGVDVLGFAFPPRPERRAMATALEELAAEVGTTVPAAEGVFDKLKVSRRALAELDELTWREGVVTGRENFDWLLRAGDFAGGVERFEADVTAFLEEARGRKAGAAQKPRLGVVGVPPINDDLFEFLADLAAAVVFNETPRQFALLAGGDDLAAAYAAYTYPYGTGPRLADIGREVERRHVDGLLHYVQAFCYRGIQDILIRRGAPVPVLTLEGERPGPLSAQQRLRLETFVDMLRCG